MFKIITDIKQRRIAARQDTELVRRHNLHNRIRPYINEDVRIVMQMTEAQNEILRARENNAAILRSIL